MVGCSPWGRRVGHYWATNTFTLPHPRTHLRGKSQQMKKLDPLSSEDAGALDLGRGLALWADLDPGTWDLRQLHVFESESEVAQSSPTLRCQGLEPARFRCPWGFSRQGYWRGLPFPSPGDLPDPGIEPGCPALQADSLPSEPPGLFILNLCIYFWLC